MVNTMGTEKIPEDRLNQIVRESFSFKPAEMINYLKLLRPIFKKTSCYGHFGRNDPDFTWEKTDMVDTLREKAGL
jgi:S-adenosylmethionine synthetase